MAHCGECSYVLWASAGDVVLRYGPYRMTKPKKSTYSGPLREMWFCAMGHSAGLVLRYGPWHQTNYHSEEHQFFKAYHSF
jgi:hypothetical protein